jgi:hypothetical protein
VRPLEPDDLVLPEDARSGPQAAPVVDRLLMSAALLERGALERDTVQAEAVHSLRAWVDEHGLYTHLGPVGLTAFEAPIGSWGAEERRLMGLVAEQLQVLAWAVGLASFPSLLSAGHAEMQQLLARVPLGGDPATLGANACMRSLVELDEQQAQVACALAALVDEVTARGVVGASLTDELRDLLEEVLEEVDGEGFETKPVEAPVASLARALRFRAEMGLSRLAGQAAWNQLTMTWLLTAPPRELGEALARVREQQGTLEWLLALDEGDEDDEDEGSMAELRNER